MHNEAKNAGGCVVSSRIFNLSTSSFQSELLTLVLLLVLVTAHCMVSDTPAKTVAQLVAEGEKCKFLYLCILPWYTVGTSGEFRELFGNHPVPM